MSVKQFLECQKPLIVGLSWDTGKKEVDLDLQCVILNDAGQIIEAVYYNNSTSKTKAILYSGDSQGQGSGFDEMCTINVKLLPSQAKYIVILTCCNSGKPMAVQNGSILIQQGEKKLTNQSLKEQGKHLSLLSAVLQKDFTGQWFLHAMKEVGDGKVFLENEVLIKKGLVKAGFDEHLFAQCQSWAGDKSFRLDKENPLVLPPQINKILLGLGWKTACDIDCSIITFNSASHEVEKVYFGNKKSADGSIVHRGDNLTGQGEEKADDEVIEIDLSKVHASVETIWSVITVFTNGKQFDDVRSAYCRLIEESSKKEFCRFQLSKNKDGVSNGCIMSCLTRQTDNTWSIIGKGFYTQDTKSASLVSPIIKQILNNDYSRVKFKDAIQEAKPQWQLNVIRAENLGSFDIGGKSDPYVKVKLNGKSIGKTPTVMLNLNPVFNYPIQLNLNVGDKLTFKISDYDRFTKDDFMGCCFMEIEQSHFDEQVKEFQLKVQNKHGKDEDKFKGTLFVQLSELW